MLSDHFCELGVDHAENEFENLRCLAQVWLLDFSPCEKYLVTYSSQEPSNPREKASVLFNVFETRTGLLSRI